MTGASEIYAFRDHEKAMELGSAALGAALRNYEASSSRRREAYRLTTRNPLAIDRPCPVEHRPAVGQDRRPPALGRDPCPRCNIRGELGCAHFAPFVAGPPLEHAGLNGARHR